jgi:metal-responsive CopG/Arc/MetJ family transcriptional regulator
MLKKENKIITVSLDKTLLEKINQGDFNRSKLIDSLLTKYFSNKKS